MKNFYITEITQFDLENGIQQASILVSYQIFGLPLGSAPVIVVNHSLTGNSNCGGPDGWWKEIIGDNKAIDTSKNTIITFNIPGNGFEEKQLNPNINFRKFTVRDTAALFWEGLFNLKIHTLFAVIGVELGGAIAWEMAVMQPNRIENLIPIAADWKITDRILATSLIQEQLLNNSEDPIVDARYYANCYFNNPDFVNQLFKRNNLDTDSIEGIEKIVSEKNRRKITSYSNMNYLLKSIDITRKRKNFSSILKTIKGTIHSIGIDSESLFPTEENRKTALLMMKIKTNSFYHEFKSTIGQDAFKIETATIAAILQPILKLKPITIQNQFDYTIGRSIMQSEKTTNSYI